MHELRWLELLEIVLSDAGATVRTARAGREAVGGLGNWKPDVLLLDISMPDMDGFDLLAAIRSSERLHGPSGRPERKFFKVCPRLPFIRSRLYVSTIELVYLSASKVPMKPAELGTLLLKARANNQSLGVSGMLVHHTGSFFQVLEGASSVVHRLFAVIERDPRHHRVVVLSMQEISQRTFGDWSMGFADGGQEDLGRLPGFNDFFHKGFKLASLSKEPGHVKDLLMAFRGGRFRQFVSV